MKTTEEEHPKEKIEMIDSANKELLSDILPVVDDFERASKLLKEDESYLEGFNLIHQKLISTLEKYNVKKMEIKKGGNFDSEYHEAITSIPSEKKYKGKIIDVVENGYHIGDNILRFKSCNWIIMSKRDFYEILGVNKSSSQEEIKKLIEKLLLNFTLIKTLTIKLLKKSLKKLPKHMRFK